jgi:long-chain acyl-CoA synthetase
MRSVRELAAGFVASGIRPGDRVALMSRTRYEWVLLACAILTAGGVIVPIYPTSSFEQVEWILRDSGAVAVVAETDDHAEKVATAQRQLPALTYVWQIDGGRFDGCRRCR